MQKPKIVTYSNEKPPVYDRCNKFFGAEWDNGVIITYGDTVHCKYEIPDHLKAHENVHVLQQTSYPGGKDKWWERYFADPLFRFSQEIEAYRDQISFAARTMNRQARRKLKDHILYDMVNSYGDMCTKKEAEAHLY